jgi:3'(2'), 5'-bisphosphate nucleotidase
LIDILQPLITEIESIGEMVYRAYRSNYAVSIKDDHSPVTEIDTQVHHSIVKLLADYFPSVPVISEEAPLPSFNVRKAMGSVWMVDPLDGTVDFIKQTDQFVISLGYLENYWPVMGILHHPVTSKTWVGIKNRGLFVKSSADRSIRSFVPLCDSRPYTILVSPHRNNNEWSRSIQEQRENELNRPVQVKSVGSALKYAYLAEGLADEVLRCVPMMAWDFAGGHAILNESKFDIVPLNPTDTINYCTQSLMLPPVTVRRRIGMQ